MQEFGPENMYARTPFINKLIEMGWKKEQIVYKPEWQVPATPSEASKREKGVSFKGCPLFCRLSSIFYRTPIVLNNVYFLIILLHSPIFIVSLRSI